jgi:uncharacterized protein (DUF1501 family)
MPTRREMLKAAINGSALVALCPTIPAFLAQSARAAGPDRDGRVLVVIQLEGGNDAINTLVPFADEGYARNRKVLRMPAKGLIRVNDRVGLHPAVRGMGDLLERGHLAIVPGVGYPNPSRSHFQSMAIWQTARLDPEELNGPGWIGRSLDERLETGASPGATGGAMLFIGADTPPTALLGRRAAATALERIEDLTLPGGSARSLVQTPLTTGQGPPDELGAFVRRSMLDAYASAERVAELTRGRATGAAVSYPNTALASRLKTVSQLLKADLPARVFYTVQSGYDTHAGQTITHYGLLNELSGAIKAFLDDLAAAKLAERVTVLCFSEFGRRVAENSSAGTDHGTAGLVFLAGQQVRAGLHGSVPSLTDLVDGDPKISTDFRRVYAAVLEDWMGLPSRSALGAKFEAMPLFRMEGV